MKSSLLFALTLGVAGLAMVRADCESLIQTCANTFATDAQEEYDSGSVTRSEFCSMYASYKDCLEGCTDEVYQDAIQNALDTADAQLKSEYGITCGAGMLAAQFAPLVLGCLCYALFLRRLL